MIRNLNSKNFLRLRLGQAGMSMAEMTIAMALVGLGALGAASLSGNMSKGSQKIQGSVAANQFATSLNAYLYSNMGCSDIKAMGALSSTPREVALTLWNYQGINRFEGGYDSSQKKKTPTMNFEIASLMAHYETAPNAATLKDSTNQVLTKSILKVNVNLKVGKMPQQYIFNVPVLIGAGNSVAYCSDEKNLAETCAAAQGKYNPATKECDLGTACKIKDTWNKLGCISDRGGSPSCSTVFGGSKTNKFTNAFTCPEGSTETRTQTETWISQRDCGKKCTENITNTMTWAICLACP
jgi:hypothetical protein